MCVTPVHCTAAWQHGNAYRVTRHSLKCARVGCYAVGRQVRGGVLLCEEHDDMAGAPVASGAEPAMLPTRVAAERDRPAPAARRTAEKQTRALRVDAFFL